MRLGTAAFLVSLLSLGSCVSPTAQDPTLPPEWKQVIRSEWAIAQGVLKCLGYQDAERIGPTQFRWIAHSEQFTCDGVTTSGCFRPEGHKIEFYTGHTWVIRHEAGHAIMWALKERPGYRCFGHYDQSFDNVFCMTYYPKETEWPKWCSLP